MNRTETRTFIKNVQKLALSPTKDDVKLAMGLLGMRGKKWCRKYVKARSSIFKITVDARELNYFTYNFGDWYVGIGPERSLVFYDSRYSINATWISREIVKY